VPATCTPALEGGKFSAAAAEAFKTLPGINIAPDILAGLHPSLRVKWTLQLARGVADVNLTERAHMEKATLGQYCGARQHFRGDHIPLGGCPGDKGDVTTPPNLYPWCLPPSEPQHVVVVECGFTSSFTHHPNVEMDVSWLLQVTLQATLESGPARVQTLFRPRLPPPPSCARQGGCSGLIDMVSRASMPLASVTQSIGGTATCVRTVSRM